MIKLRRARKAFSNEQQKHTDNDLAAEYISKQTLQARSIAERYMEGEAKLDADMFAIMRCAKELHDKFATSDESGAPLQKAFEREKIRITKHTTSKFIPIMKLLAPQLPSSTRGRSASILVYADQNGIKAEELDSFIRESGGIVKCARAARALSKPYREQKAAEQSDRRLLTLRNNAKRLGAPVLQDGLTEGIWCCLIEEKADQLSLLAVSPGRIAKEFKPIDDEEFLDFGERLLST